MRRIGTMVKIIILLLRNYESNEHAFKAATLSSLGVILCHKSNDSAKEAMELFQGALTI